MLQRCTFLSHIIQGSTCLATKNCFSTRLAMGTVAFSGLGSVPTTHLQFQFMH
jgi:hypothetical protein